MLLGLVNSLAYAHDGRRGPLVHLVGQPHISSARGITGIAEGGTRLLAFLALRRGAADRRHVAGSLWPAVGDARAAGNLRSALWRLNASDVPLVRTTSASLELRDEVSVDVHLLADWAARVISGSARPHDLAVMPWDLDHLDVLPGWYDDWILIERERLRQRLCHALERLSGEMVRQRRYAEAVEAALITVLADPLRESAQRVLIEAYLAEGNWAEARLRYESYRDLLGRELGVRPSASLAALVSATVGG